MIAEVRGQYEIWNTCISKMRSLELLSYEYTVAGAFHAVFSSADVDSQTFFEVNCAPSAIGVVREELEFTSGVFPSRKEELSRTYTLSSSCIDTCVGRWLEGEHRHYVIDTDTHIVHIRSAVEPEVRLCPEFQPQGTHEQIDLWSRGDTTASIPARLKGWVTGRVVSISDREDGFMLLLRNFDSRLALKWDYIEACFTSAPEAPASQHEQSAFYSVHEGGLLPHSGLKPGSLGLESIWTHVISAQNLTAVIFAGTHPQVCDDLDREEE